MVNPTNPKKDLNTIKTMKIDEEKEFQTYKVEIQGTKQCRKIYSDHNAIMLNIDFISKMEAKGKKKTITRNGYQKYKKFIKERQISKIIKKGTLQESYNKWPEEVEDAIQQVQKTVRKKTKKRHKGAAEDKEESQDKDKKYSRCL